MPIRKQLSNEIKQRYRSPELWIHSALFFFLGFAFWPVTRWFAATANDQSRISHALIVLMLATVFLVRFGRVEINAPLRLNPSARKALITSFALLTLTLLLPWLTNLSPSREATFQWLSLFSIPAYCFGLASFLLFVFGEGAKRVIVTVSSTFCAFLLLSLLMTPLDWPLRGLAGQWSGWALAGIGKTVELGLVSASNEPPMLVLLVNEHPFHVASECNGFGVIFTSLLIAILLGIYRKHRPLDFLLNIIAGLFLGFVFNTIRILVIVLLAPHMMDHYDLMHEVVGGITYWGCLVLIWFLLNGPVRDEPDNKIEKNDGFAMKADAQ